jgi:spermidine synthase
MPLPRLLLLFFVSGACGLVYQVVWMRALSLTLSVSVVAVTTTLCAFMAGLGLGAALAGRIADRLERPLFAFGLAEIGVGLTGLASLSVLFDLGPAYAWLYGQLGGSGPALHIGRFLLATAVLIVPTTLMGTTLPLLSRASVDRREVVGRGAGGLYAVNTLGAVAGTLAAGFWLVPELGLSTTARAAACANLAIGMTAAAIGWRARRAAPPAAAAHESADPGRVVSPTGARLAALGFGVSGFTAMGYEVLWTRALEQFTHNSTYAYTAMLATFLLGIGGGSAVAAPLADRVRRPVAAFGWIQLAIGASVVTSLFVYMQLLDWIPAVTQAAGGLGSWSRAVALMFGVAASTLLATTLLFGATFPFVACAVVDTVDAVGRRVAGAYALNTVGSILGSLLVGFILLPTLGLRDTFAWLVAANLVLGVSLVLVATRALEGGIARRALPLVAVAVPAALLLWVPSELFRGIFEKRYGKLLMYREQITDIVMVTEDAQGHRLIRYGDGRGTAGTITVNENRFYAHAALLLHPRPRRVLSICFGVGNSLSAVTQYPVEHIDQVELSPGVVHAAPFFRATNRDVLADPRVTLTIEDGRNFLLAHRERWDVINLEPPELHTAGIVNLYTREFFELARERLAPGGIFSLWVNVAYTPEADTKAILRTLAEVFPHVTVWHSPWLFSWVMNGSLEPRPPDLALLQRWFSEPRVSADLNSIPIRDPFEFLDHFVMADGEVREWVGDAPLVVDDHTRIDFSVPRSEEAFFGLSNSITDYYLADLMNFDLSVSDRSFRYCAHKRPVAPHVRNSGAAELDPRVRARLSGWGSLAGRCEGDVAARAASLAP